MPSSIGVNEGGPTGEPQGPGGGFDSETGAIGQVAPPVAVDSSIEKDVSRHDIFFAAVEATRMPMIVTDPRQPDNPIVFCNPAFQQMTGYTFEEIRGRNCRLLQGPDTDRTVIDELRQAIDQRREIAVEILNYRKNGSAFWNALFMSPVFNQDGELVYYFGSQLDVSRRRDAEDALRQAQKMESLGQLTGGIAHDFNNLLQVILGYLDGIKAKGVTNDPAYAEAALDAIGLAATRGATLTNQLLSFARKQRLDGRLVNLNAVVAGFKPLIERTVGGTIAIETRLDPALANTKVDTTQAELALLNVLINARDAMPNGGRIMVETAMRDIADEDRGHFGELGAGRYVTLSITDTGTGIPPEILKRVTEPFFTTKEQGKGTGLGLSMAYGFAKQSGGMMRLTSEVGHGTTVRFFFPAVQQSPEPRGAQPPRPLDQRAGTEVILIVEDQEDVGQLAQSVLEDFGYKVLRAPDGLEAMDILEGDERIDLLFTDLIMPGGINGVMLARRARQARPRLKVLLTTGYAELSFERETAGGSEFDLINKPYRRSELAAKVRQVLDGPTGVG
ncbi:histidine kinase famiy protein [Rubellimicrobium arenae]|uniref:histidine kinase famiy protein n=1 Tax=Rubellimicrobium arenae TaxID=2817372 RepID=UPI001B3127CA|nr:histidine kinase famiy protein [Rubellimicrobium arenae]